MNARRPPERIPTLHALFRIYEGTTDPDAKEELGKALNWMDEVLTRHVAGMIPMRFAMNLSRERRCEIVLPDFLTEDERGRVLSWLELAFRAIPTEGDEFLDFIRREYPSPACAEGGAA